VDHGGLGVDVLHSPKSIGQVVPMGDEVMASGALSHVFELSLLIKCRNYLLAWQLLTLDLPRGLVAFLLRRKLGTTARRWALAIATIF
jgi:hypothetical protein